MSALFRFLSFVSLSAAAFGADDMLRFENGDQLHGTFHGIADDGSIRFQNAEMKEPAEFGVSQLRHLVLRGGKPERPAETLTHVELVNNDLIPGKIVGFDGSHLTLESGFLGALRIPRDQLTMLAINPMGGRIHYHGPFSEDGWEKIEPAGSSVEPAKGDAKDGAAKGWEFSGSAWYWKGEGKPYIRSGNYTEGALVMKDVMTDCSILRFRIDWRERLGVSLVFHADLETGDPEKADDEFKEARKQGAIPSLVGNAYVVQMYSSHVMLYRSVWGKKGETSFERVQNTTSMQLSSDRTALVEVRSNRKNGRISLFVNDEFLAQWSEPFGEEGEGFAGTGGGIGFAPLPGMGAIRISEVLVSEWNGLPDSARSMKLEEKDVVLMTNGTDRFSGKAVRLNEENKLVFEGAHGTFFLPLDEIEEIRFASSGFSKPAAEKDQDPVPAVLHLSPVGRFTAKSMKGDRNQLKVEHPLLGQMDLGTEPLIMIEYEPGQRLSDFWNEDL